MKANRVADSLQSARTGAGLTMEQVAEQLGVTRQAVSMWESGQRPGGPARRLLAQLFDLPLEVVEGWWAERKVAA